MSGPRITAFMTSLRKRGVRMETDGQSLRLTTADGLLPEELRAAIVERKAEVIAFMVQAQQSRDDTTIQPADGNAPLPLSFAQLRIWILDQMKIGTAYNVSSAIKMRGPLNVRALERTLNAIVERHQVLRTTYRTTDDGNPEQVIHTHRSQPLPLIDLSNCPDREQSDALEAEYETEIFTPFDLERDLMLRGKVLRLGHDCHLLLLTTHHIASDGWSLGILGQEMATLYAAYIEEQPSPLPRLKVQYADFARWQRALLQVGEEDGKWARQLAYWKARLDAAPPLLQMPTDRPRTVARSFQGSVVTFQIDARLSDRLKRLSLEADATLFMTLLAAFQLLLLHYTGQEEIVVGTPIANRNRRELEPLIGCFANTLALRTDLSGNPTFVELLVQVRDTAREAYDHQDLPFEQLVEALQPERSLTHNPLVQVMLSFRNTPQPDLAFGGLHGEVMTFHAQNVRMDMELHLYEQENRLIGNWIYDTALFEQDTVERMVDHFQTLLTSIVAAPQQPIADIPYLTEPERHRILHSWNETTAGEVPASLMGKTIHQLFEEQVVRTPDAVALHFDGRHITYAELNRRANQVARHLHTLGVGDGSLVGICVERSVELILALLGTLKAGVAYVPLDPALPQARLDFMLQDANVAVLLTQEHLLVNPAQGTFSSHNGSVRPLKTVCLDRDWFQIAELQGSNLGLGVEPDALAYLIYTSGSTGQPKGVEIPHRALTNFLGSMRVTPGLQQQDMLLSVTTVSFDIAALELYLPLIVGAQILLADRATTVDGAALVALMNSHPVTIMQATPATWQLLLQSGWQGSQDLKILCGGEAMSQDLSAQLLERCRELWNVYGPTETTVWSLVHRIRPDDTHILIGRPIANTQAYILDKQLNPAPVGAVGTLYIGGAGVANGYRNRSGLTRERFIDNPFGAGRIYNTGDLARYRMTPADPVPAIECLGRTDRQCKLRGFRIEPGEIESRLTLHPAIQEAAVIVREDQPGKRELVGYLVAGESDIETSTEHVQMWQQRWEQTYMRAHWEEEQRGALAGWISSYTGRPIPSEEMAEWVDEVVADVRQLRPQRVLEIGCGTGMLVSRLAPECSEYHATDNVRHALDFVEGLIANTPGLGHVQLAQRAADDFAGVEAGSFDCVILNSVIQYFPDSDYLLRVLTGAVRALKPGGVVYIGDVRNLRLLRAFHTAVQLYQAADDLSLAELRTQISQRIEDEAELLIDPDFFHALPTRIGQIEQVEVRLKRGRARNEMNEFRYQVLLRTAQQLAGSTNGTGIAMRGSHYGQATNEHATNSYATNSHETTSHETWQEAHWIRESWTLATVADRLQSLCVASPDQGLLLRDVPNGRLQRTMQAMALIDPQHADGRQIETVADVRARLETGQEGPDPAAFLALAGATSYHIHFSWADTLGLMDVCFTPRRDSDAAAPRLSSVALDERAPIAWHSYANTPAQGKLHRSLIPKVLSWLREALPEHMVPTTLHLLDALPLTPTSKVDYRALAGPEFALQAHGTRPAGQEHSVPPQTSIELCLAEIWSAVLEIDDIGIHDNFFALGGHSLLAVRICQHVQEQLSVALSVDSLFTAPTIFALAQEIDSDLPAAGHDRAIQELSRSEEPIEPTARPTQTWIETRL